MPRTKQRPAARPERPSKNTAEAECWNLLTESGWTPTKRGWPDLWAVRLGHLCCVEVKPKRGRRLKRQQRQLMMQMAKHGIQCYQFDPDDGFQRISPYTKNVGIAPNIGGDYRGGRCKGSDVLNPENNPETPPPNPKPNPKAVF